MSIFKRIFWLMVITNALIIAVVITMTIGYQRQAIEVEADYNMTANLSIIMSQLKQTVENFEALGLCFSNNKAFTAYFESLDLKDEVVVSEALEILQKIKASSDILNNVTLTPRGGEIRMDARGAFFDQGPNESQLEYYKELSGNPSMKSFINKPLIGTANNQPIFGIGIQMDNEGQFLGIIGLPINLNRLMDTVIMPDVTDQDIKVLMVNSGGTVVWSSEPALIHNEEVNFQLNEPDFFGQITSKKKGSLQQKLLGINAQIKYEYYDAFDAYIIIYKDISPYNERLLKVVIFGVLIGFVIIIFSGILTYIILLQITKPIHMLVDYSNQVANEQFDIEIAKAITERPDEIGILGRTYETMIESLNKSFVNLRSAGEKYHLLANSDELTNLPNRRNFSQSVAVIQSDHKSGSLVMMDIDNFKNINDTMGHIVGDDVLKHVAGILQEVIGQGSFLSRFGGDEFIFYTKDNESGMRVEQFVKTMTDRFRSPLNINGIKIDVKFSMGVARYPMNSGDLNELIRQADIALYMAKYHGKNRAEYFEESMEKRVLKKMNIEKAISNALTNDGFELLYQPQVDLKTGKVSCYEALLRFKDRSFRPDEFISVAEESLQIIEIGRWVVSEAVKQVAKWQNQGHSLVKVSVNFSGVQLQDEGFDDYLMKLLEAYNVSGKALELEVTESVFIQQEEKVMAFFKKIAAQNIDLSLDDFGAGYSSLTYMISFPVSKIKLDRLLIQKYLAEDEEHAVEKLISLIHSLGYTIVAEGVETEEDVKKLCKANCDYIQGYYFCKPVEPGNILGDGNSYVI